MMFYRPPAQDARAGEATGEAWAKIARIIYVAHGGKHPAADETPVQDPAS